MPLTDFLNALDTIENKAPHFMVVLTGGEPLLREDIELCGRELRKRGVRWSIVTNGMLYNAERHNSLLNAGMGALTISLDGLEKSHNWLRNSTESFNKVDNAITLAASARRLNFDVVSCINKQNIDELNEIYSYLCKKNVKAWRLFTIAPIGRAKNNSKLLLSNDEMKTLFNFISEKRKNNEIDVKFSCEAYTGKYETYVRDSYFFCRAGINIGSVLIDGSISACPNIDRSFVQGNIYADNFNSIWDERFQPFRERQWTKTGKCAICSDYKKCKGSGMHLWHGDKSEILVCHAEMISYK